MAVNGREACDGGLSSYMIVPTLGAIIGGGTYRLIQSRIPKADSGGRPFYAALVE